MVSAAMKYSTVIKNKINCHILWTADIVLVVANTLCLQNLNTFYFAVTLCLLGRFCVFGKLLHK